ncbi:MAG: flagellar M-ring protein [Gemmatimonadota bacterium]|nr:MAG: flagellar M-ring protein [Gemmatimonadota bacterium]
MGSVASRLGAAWNVANTTQRTLVLGGLAAGILSLVLVFNWTSQPDMMVLFSGLEAEEASGILEELDELTVPYVTSANGATIRVPADRVGELRIRLAGKGLTGNSTIGYEIFDRSNLGMTEFLQQVNYRRALEGELTRTIVSLGEVKNARIHLAIPEDDVFARDRKAPKASVILELMPGGRLRADQIRGIYALIAASVEGLDPSAVTLVDSTGRELGGGGQSGEFAATTEQLRIQQDVENHLRQKATSLLEQVVGAGNAVVQVTASLDFERVERSTESYNPASATIRSEQRILGNGTGGDSQETTLTNYEIDKTVESLLSAVGTVKKVSVAVLVNGSVTPDADGTPVYSDRPAAELATLGAIVKDAIGFDETRGDALEIANLRFTEAPGADLSTSPMPWWLLFPSMGSLIRNLVILFAIGMVAWGLRQSSSILVEAVEADRRRRERVLKVEKNQEDDNELRKEVIREQMNDLAHERPNEVAQVLRSWLIEEKSS